LDLAYLAGFMDGEGTIGLRRIRRADRGGAFSYEPYIEVANTDPVIPVWLHSLFGGYYRERATTLGGNSKPVIYRWATKSRAAVAVCERLVPYLRLKRPQAEVLLSAFALRRAVGGRRNFSPAERSGPARRALPTAQAAESTGTGSR
jgi:hypothetical protein